MSEVQLQLPQTERYGEAEVRALRSFLEANGWQTRRQICAALGWNERKVRDVAELMGPEIIRGQAGFKLTAKLDRSDAALAIQARDAAVSQGKKMIRYGMAIGRKIHALVG